jgi:hypothetical protein
VKPGASTVSIAVPTRHAATVRWFVDYLARSEALETECKPLRTKAARYAMTAKERRRFMKVVEAQERMLAEADARMGGLSLRHLGRSAVAAIRMLDRATSAARARAPRR